jgi:hypothetical protein
LSSISPNPFSPPALSDEQDLDNIQYIDAGDFHDDDDGERTSDGDYEDNDNEMEGDHEVEIFDDDLDNYQPVRQVPKSRKTRERLVAIECTGLCSLATTASATSQLL